MRSVAALSLLTLAACAAPSARTIYDQLGRQVTIVDTGVDQAGGLRVVAIGQFDSTNTYHPYAAGSAPGTVQTVLPALVGAGGFVGGLAVLRPSPVNVSQSGGSSSTGAVTANGGAGGLGGSGGAGGNGGAALGGTGIGGSAAAMGGSASARTSARAVSTSSSVGFVDP